jgi:uncharacterized protein (TIGR02284 family)
MERKEEPTQVLNDLLKINNDRIKEYKKAVKEIVDFEWRTIFLTNIDESKKFALELSLAIMQNGGEPKINATTTSGKIYRFWTEIKDTFTGRDRESILNECEFVEDAMLKAYSKALEHEDLNDHLKKVIGKQYETLRSSHLMINHYRDMALMNLYKI